MVISSELDKAIADFYSEYARKTNKEQKMVAAQEIEGRAMQATIAKSSSTIHSEIERTAELLFNLGDLLDRLDNKVYSVSMQQPENDNVSPVPAPPMVSSVANSIWEKNEKLQAACYRLDSIINRIDL